MSATAATSVVSFSVVLAEAFAAVGLSTAVPAAVVTLARLAKNARTNAGHINDTKAALGKLPTGPLSPEELNKLLGAVEKALPSLDLLLPKTADIHAEFTFEGKEGMTAGAAGGVAINVVSVSAGYSAMYEMKSTNKITLDVHFESVNVVL